MLRLLAAQCYALHFLPLRYPAQMWSDAAAYFAGLRGEETLLPGGRYACARALQERQIPFFEGRSLGDPKGGAGLVSPALMSSGWRVGVWSCGRVVV